MHESVYDMHTQYIHTHAYIHIFRHLWHYSMNWDAHMYIYGKVSCAIISDHQCHFSLKDGHICTKV